jgi:clan AA aspartic protease
LNGRVDEAHRALVDVEIRHKASDKPTSVTAWVDTAFNGFFVFPRHLIKDLALHQEAATDAILANGSRVTLESFVCYVEWFGETIAAQVVANDGKLPLLGTELLVNRRLLVDYVNRTVSIT